MVYDVILIGECPGGYNAALEGAKHQLKTMVIETNFIGGTCLKEGCIPTKILLKSAEVLETVKSATSFGVTTEKLTYDHGITIERKNKLVQQLNKGVLGNLKKAQVEIMQGFGELVGRESGFIHVACDGEVYRTKHVIRATGSSPMLPKIERLGEASAKQFVLNSTQLLNALELPEKLVIVGGGVVGIEMAEVFHKLGVEIEILEFQPTIGGVIDTDLAVAMRTMLEKRGIKVVTGAIVSKFSHSVVEYVHNGQTCKTAASKVLISTGRKGNIDAISLDKLGIETERGFIQTNDFCATNSPNIYAIGDVNGKSLLAHTAYREAEVAIQAILGNKERMNYNAIPSVIYTSPEMASVGLTAEQAATEGIDVKIIKVPLIYSGRFLIEESNTNSFLKVIIEKRYNKIVGMHLFAPFASEIIFGMTILVEQEMRIKDLKRIVLAHPSIAEILKEVVTIYEMEEALA